VKAVKVEDHLLLQVGLDLEGLRAVKGERAPWFSLGSFASTTVAGSASCKEIAGLHLVELCAPPGWTLTPG
jgi:hypothetical protein